MVQTLVVWIIVVAAAAYVCFYLYRKITRKNDCSDCTEDCANCGDAGSCKIKELKSQMREHHKTKK